MRALFYLAFPITLHYTEPRPHHLNFDGLAHVCDGFLKRVQQHALAVLLLHAREKKRVRVAPRGRKRANSVGTVRASGVCLRLIALQPPAAVLGACQLGSKYAVQARFSLPPCVLVCTYHVMRVPTTKLLLHWPVTESL